MDCPICDDPFDSEDELNLHLKLHQNQSILNSPSEKQIYSEEKYTNSKINIQAENFFGKKLFEELIYEKLKNIDDVEELVDRRNFVEDVKKIISKHPFVHIPYFIEDVIHGKGTQEILEKYYISYHTDLKNITHNVLKFDRNRYHVKQYEDAFEMNLKIHTWNEKYERLKNNCEFFKNELLELIFFNVLRSFIIIIITDYVQSGISKNDIIIKSNLLRDNFDIFKFIDEPLEKSFQKYFNVPFEKISIKILDELIDGKILRKNTLDQNTLVGGLSIDKIKQKIIDELKYNDGSQNESTIRASTNEEFPSLRLIPGLGVWEAAVTELAHDKIIHLESKSHFKNSSIIFLNENYEKILQNLKHFDGSSLKFYGREISPEKFIYELTDLEKGDFNDQDDQVTRIAGLVLAESVKVHATPEDLPQFDFITDITNYNFRNEQLKAMEKLDFKIMSNIIHCKVMLNEILNLKKYNELKKDLPANEQGIVINFKKIPFNVQQILETDKSIQIIDEEGLKIWVSISSVIPSRKHSMAKLHYDPITKLNKKLVKINLIDYEDGLASVSILPEMNEVTVLAGCLEEIPLFESKPSDFELYSKNYLQFLNILSAISTYENLIDGFFQNKFIEEPTGCNTELEVKFDYNTVHLDLSTGGKYSTIKCNCMQYAENSLYLCSHLVSALDYMFRKFLFGGESWPDSNNFKNTLDVFACKNIKIILDKLAATEEKGEIQDNSRLSDFVFGMNKIKSNF